ncbi:MAG: hypothetical protein OZ916_08370 [Nitrosomonas sp.]|uniref:hypothetical protein n=1 Tax=Nitrosomonas sp. TaxID=42353 RepID=UPI002B3F70E6|nr:hypothetical protein [Nitrosomonas sp.]MEB2332285.1 hypothetical protein [Nitrosomonas sp.]
MTVPAEVIEAPHIKELEEENELLLSQLHLVQEELEKYYLRNKELESRQTGKLQGTTPSAKGWVDDELPDALAENSRLQTLIEVQQKVHQLETQNALNARLGNILIESVDSSGSLLSVPGKLRKIWKEENRQTPPESLGGSNFSAVIAAYGEGGFDAVEALIAAVSISPAMQASALTALARHLMANDRTQAAEAARRAYTLDPKPFRLKWLAFRLHEAGEVAEAEAMLAILPADTPFSDSEARQASQLRSEAKNIRQRAAKQQTAFFERRAEIEKQLRNLTQERDKQSKLAAERSHEIEKCNRELKSLKQEHSRLEQEKAAQVKRCEEAESQVTERDQEIGALKQAQIQLEQEKAALAQQNAEQVQLTEERGREIEALKQVQAQQEQTLAQLEQEKQTLKAQQEESGRQLAERDQEIGALKQVKMQLEQEKAALAQQNAEQVQLTEERGREIEALKQIQAQQEQTLVQLEQEKQTLKAQQEESRKQLVERDRKIEELKHAQTQLTQEKAAQTKQRDEAEKLAAERLKQINELQQQIQSHQASEAELAVRQQHMQEEMARAEAQLDLIKELLLREPVL